MKKHGFTFGGPFLEKIAGTKELWELRIKYSSDIYRILFFSYLQGKFVLLHGFIKKTAKLPTKELKIALGRLKKFKLQSGLVLIRKQDALDDGEIGLVFTLDTPPR